MANRGGSLFFQIVHRRQVRQIATGLRLSAGEWNPAMASVIIRNDTDPARLKHLLSVKEKLAEQRSRLKATIAQLESRRTPYTVEDIADMFKSDSAVVGVASFTRKLVAEIKQIGKRAAAKRYQTTLNCFLRYTGGKEIAWNDITPTFILGYEEFMARSGLCRNSTSFYMRNLRSILNRAADRGFDIPQNPFKHVYMGVDKTQKRAVDLETIRKIRDLDLTGHPSLDFARNVFMFAFYTRGMSFVDIAFLKKSDVRGGFIIYSRRKTRQQLCVRIENETKMIIDRFGKNNSPYLLPIITNGETNPDRQYEMAYYRVNRNIQKVGRLLELGTKLTLYVARHAWASIALANNVAVSTISRAMGHDSEKTTIIYLQSLDTSAVDKANSDIIKMMDAKR